MPDILVIESDEAVCVSVARCLERAGHTVTTCPDGQKAMDLLLHTRFDLIVTAIILDGVDGVQVLSWLEAQPDRPPVIAMSQGNDQLPAEMALLLGRTYGATTMPKPVDNFTLLDLVETALRIPRGTS